MLKISAVILLEFQNIILESYHNYVKYIHKNKIEKTHLE